VCVFVWLHLVFCCSPRFANVVVGFSLLLRSGACVRVRTCASGCLFVCFVVGLFVCWFARFFVCCRLFVRLFGHLFVCVLICLSVCCCLC